MAGDRDDWRLQQARGVTQSDRGLPDWGSEQPRAVLRNPNDPGRPIFPPDIVPNQAPAPPAPAHKPHHRRRPHPHAKAAPAPVASKGFTPDLDLRRYRQEWVDTPTYAKGEPEPRWLRRIVDQAPWHRDDHHPWGIPFGPGGALLATMAGVAALAVTPEELALLLATAAGVKIGEELIKGAALHAAREQIVEKLQNEWRETGPKLLKDLKQKDRVREFKTILISEAQRAEVNKLLGHTFSEASQPSSSQLMRRIAAKLPQVYESIGETARSLAEQEYKKLLKASPQDRLDAIREGTFRRFRQRFMNLIYRDEALRADLEREAGIFIHKTKKGAQMYLLGVDPTDHVNAAFIDRDHKFELSNAVKLAFGEDKPAALMAGWADWGLQFLTQAENQSMARLLRNVNLVRHGISLIDELRDVIWDE